jgi:hypothetical protein
MGSFQPDEPFVFADHSVSCNLTRPPEATLSEPARDNVRFPHRISINHPWSFPQ